MFISLKTTNILRELERSAFLLIYRIRVHAQLLLNQTETVSNPICYPSALIELISKKRAGFREKKTGFILILFYLNLIPE